MNEEIKYTNELSLIELTIANEFDEHYSLGVEKRQFLHRVCRFLPENASIVELGVCHGSTGFLLATVAKRLNGKYIGIDNWSLEGSLEEVRDKFLSLVGPDAEDNGVWELGKFNSHDSDLAKTVVEDDPYSLLLIDAGHDEANVRQDCEVWIPLAKSGAIVAFDDYPATATPNPNLDPHWAVKTWADAYTGSWDLIGYWNGLMVRRKP